MPRNLTQSALLACALCACSDAAARSESSAERRDGVAERGGAMEDGRGSTQRGGIADVVGGAERRGALRDGVAERGGAEPRGGAMEDGRGTTQRGGFADVVGGRERRGALRDRVAERGGSAERRGGAMDVGSSVERRDVVVELDGSAERRLVLRDVVIEPAENVLSARVDARGVVSIARVDRMRGLTVSAPGLCPVVVPGGPQAGALTLRPVLELGGDRTGIGFGARFSVQVRHNCLAQDRGQIAWRQLEGPALAELQLTDAGYQLSARTVSFAEVHPEPVASGIVAISPRTQGRVVLEASWRGQGAPQASRTLSISAAARSTGLSSVAVSQPIVLAGDAWQVQARPPAGHASVQQFDGMTFFAPDAPGSWTLSSAQHSSLKLQALTHDSTPYDCGRAECHASISEHTQTSAMSHALEHPLAAQTDFAAVSCMLDCHVLGERGLSDGGFQAVSARLGFTWTEHTRWQDLPQALRRLGGVRCTACHGPGAIPPPEQRSAILRSDVCASCHDAPPRYAHVAQWRSGRMATSDRDAATRQASCARCHTTAGFLAHAGVRKPTTESTHAEPAGIACAVCHAPHAAERGPRLIRNADAHVDDAGDLFAEQSTTLCRSCHSASHSAATSGERAVVSGERQAASGEFAVVSGERQAASGERAAASGERAAASGERAAGVGAPGGALWGSQIFVPAQGAGWERLASRWVHETVPRGCIGCHGGAALQPGAVDHSFRVDERVCATCHVDDVLRAGRTAAAELRSRALAMARVLEPGCTSLAPTPHAQLDSIHCSNRRQERARYEIGVVLDDAAALFHNPDLSRMLLSDAAQQLSELDAL